MYSLVFQIYVWLFHLVALFNKKAAKMVRGQRETYDRLSQALQPDDRVLWFHAASLGEFEQGRPLMEEIRRNHPRYKLLLTFYSPSGYEVRKDYAGADVVCYLPFDTPSNVHRFLKLAHPAQAFFIKYEFWPNYLLQLGLRKVPVVLVSGIFRPGQAFFRFGGRPFRWMLGRFEHLFVQNRESAELLAHAGLGQKVEICGDTRCDRVLAIASEAKNLFILDEFTGKGSGHPSQVLIAGSSWPADEEKFIPYFNAHPNLKLIIAPHQIHESHLQYIESLVKRPCVRYSQLTAQNAAGADCVIIDCFGLLSSIYRYGQMAYIGGAFGAGLHNTLEAAVYGIPVVFGPKYNRFDEAKALVACGGGVSISSAEELNACLDRWLSDATALETAGRAAGDYVRQNSGSTARIYAYVAAGL